MSAWDGSGRIGLTAIVQPKTPLRHQQSESRPDRFIALHRPEIVICMTNTERDEDLWTAIWIR